MSEHGRLVPRRQLKREIQRLAAIECVAGDRLRVEIAVVLHLNATERAAVDQIAVLVPGWVLVLETAGHVTPRARVAITAVEPDPILDERTAHGWIDIPEPIG